MAGFGVEEEDQPTLLSSTYTFKDSLKVVLEKAVEISILPDLFLPKYMAAARYDFSRYLKSLMIIDVPSKCKSTRENGALLAALVKANQTDDKVRQASGQLLTEAELSGNIFVLAAAGYETTASTITNAIYILSINPEVQEWVREEIRNVVDEYGWNYATVFPKLVRCLSIMYETLRIYGVVDSVIRHTREHTIFDFTDVAELDRRLPARIEVPPNIHTIPVIGSLHTHPLFWGSKSLDFDPKRWIKRDLSKPPSEALENPAQKDTFFPWSGGLLACIGKKFSQVEFVATISHILYDRWIVPIPLDEEDEPALQRRVLSILESVELSPGRKMIEPQKVSFRFPKVRV
ncbi:hypothetical protein TWF694_005239 [Orbilia ellipsospora]|uniref:Cytochrome P450 n=1 Tax=Orbilia ellipsospora TaxID=2528407 RepID=A0AAV9WTR7_9PEZI